jgi:hypothetical protein
MYCTSWVEVDPLAVRWSRVRSGGGGEARYPAARELQHVIVGTAFGYSDLVLSCKSL